MPGQRPSIYLVPLAVLILSILNHPCSLMVYYYYLFGVFHDSIKLLYLFFFNVNVTFYVAEITQSNVTEFLLKIIPLFLFQSQAKHQQTSRGTTQAQ